MDPRLYTPGGAKFQSERLLGRSFATYFGTFAFGLFVLFVVLAITTWSNSLPLVESSEMVTLSQRPLVVIGENEDAFLSFTSSEVTYKRFIFFGKTSVPYENHLTLLLLPGIVLYIGFLTAILALLGALLFAVVGSVIIKKRFRNVFVVTLHNQLIPLMVFFVLFAFGPIAYISILLFAVQSFFAYSLLKGYEMKSVNM